MSDLTLARFTTLQVGGDAERLVIATTREQLLSATREAWGGFDEWLLLGGGSNVVVADDGFAGTVVHVATRGIERVGASRLRIQAGEPWDAVVAFAVAHGLSGIESLSGIPGTTGAAPIQNIGAYGQDLAQTLVSVELLDYLSGELVEVPAAELELGYRTSALKQGKQGLVVAVELELESSTLSQPIDYAQLAAALGAQLGDRALLVDVRAAVLELRASKGMLLDPVDPDSVSAGSFFTNPIVSESFARGLPADAPRWPTAPEEAPRVLPLGTELANVPRASGGYQVKLSAAWLIERSGIHRGFALPGSRAAISSKHTLAIVNRGGATAADVAQLAGYVQTRVLSEFGVLLNPEPVLIGLDL